MKKYNPAPPEGLKPRAPSALPPIKYPRGHFFTCSYCKQNSKWKMKETTKTFRQYNADNSFILECPHCGYQGYNPKPFYRYKVNR